MSTSLRLTIYYVTYFFNRILLSYIFYLSNKLLLLLCFLFQCNIHKIIFIRLFNSLYIIVLINLCCLYIYFVNVIIFGFTFSLGEIGYFLVDFLWNFYKRVFKFRHSARIVSTHCSQRVLSKKTRNRRNGVYNASKRDKAWS